MKIAIVIATYQRIDNTTPNFLTRALQSIKNQTHQDYVVYLIGDKYEDNIEFEVLATSIIDKNKIKYINLPISIEREKYKAGSIELWSSAGTNAYNFGINLAIEDGISYVCHLDHDDYWEYNHLMEISNVLDTKNYLFVATLSTHFKNNVILPKIRMSKYFPKRADVIHSATCVNFAEINLRYRDVYDITGIPKPGDADMWERITEYMNNINEYGHLIETITCHHDFENH